MASWNKPSGIALSLPKVNQLLPEAFELKTANMNVEKPQKVIDDNGVQVWHYPSQAFKNQPKGVMHIYFNSPERQQGIEGQVLFSLWADLFSLNQSALSTEAAIAGMNLSLSGGNGMEMVIDGFTDKQPVLLQRGLDAMTFKVEPVSFEQAVDRYVRRLKNGEKAFPFRQLFGKFNRVISSSGFTNSDLVKAAKSLKPEDLHEFMEKVLANNNIRMFAFGNYNKKDLKHFAQQVNKTLPEHRKVTDYTRTKYWQPKQNEVLSWKEDLEVADVAILDLHVHPEASLKQEARGRVLQGHLRTAAFDTLRTEEQLAYAVFALAPKIKEHTALGFGIQTPVKDVADMQKRFDTFKKEYLKKLNAITAEEFAMLKNSVLVSLNEKPKNLGEEQQRIINDWYDEKWDFDSRDKLIAEVEKVTLDDIKAFYRETVLNKNAARVSVQLRGSKFKEKPFADLKGEKEVKDLSKFHKETSYQ